MKTITQKDKTKEEFIEEIRLLQKRIAELEIADTESKNVEQIVWGQGEARAYAESIIETVREPLIVLGDDLKVVSANKSFYQTFKVNPNETKGQFIYDLGNRQWDIPKLRKLLDEILPKSSVFENYEIEHNFETIGQKTMLLNARRIYREANKTQMILLAIEDITERKEIEAGLEKTRKELVVIKQSADEVSEFAESVINTVREPLISLDQDLRVVTVSRSFYEFFKVKPEDTVGQLIYNLGNKQWDIPKLRELLETILPQKTTFDNYEVEHDFTTIGRRIMLLNARQIERASGKERIILLAIEDITERKETEAGLEKTRKELVVIKQSADEVSEFAESVINTVREPLISLDQDLRVVMVSRSFYEFFKVKPEETVGQLIYDLGNKQWNIPKLRELLETILPQKTTFDNYEVEHNFPDIGKKIMLLNARQIQRVWGKERIILLAIEDITERKQTEDKIEKLNMELSTAVKELGAFSYSVSHDLKAPLRAMAGFSNILSEDYAPKLDDNGRRLIGVINDNARTMGQLIDDLLELSHLGRQTMAVVDIDMTALVQSVCHELKEDLFRDRAIEVSVKPLPPARADLTLAKQIFINLISNAMKFTSHKDKALIEIGGYDKGQDRVYYVKDNGAGFDMKYVDKLFGVFQRLHSQDEFSGTGIGLAIVSNAVRRHGGTVWAEGEVDKGATFYFTLPKGG